jgi:hypothetical protein
MNLVGKMKRNCIVWIGESLVPQRSAARVNSGQNFWKYEIGSTSTVRYHTCTLIMLSHFDLYTDKTFLQYKQIFAEPHPELSDISLLREWIEKPSLGGGCGFFGLDLGTESPTVYDDQYKNDLMRVVGTRGEDDPFTKLITGRLFYIFDNILQFFKVSRIYDV